MDSESVQSSDEEFHGWDSTLEQEDFWNSEEAGWLREIWENDDESEQASNENQQQPVVRRTTRSTAGVPPVRYDEEVFSVKQAYVEPKSYQEAMSSLQRAEWIAAMDDEMQSHYENGTWELTELPKTHRAIGCKWIYKCKTNENGNLVRYKARLVAQGFCQKYGTEYDLVFAPVVRQITFRLVLSIASRRRMLAKHLDIKTAYLYGQLKEEIYMLQPPGYGSKNPKMVCRLRRSLYGLKQAARIWNKEIDHVLKCMRFVPSKADPCLYVRFVDGKYEFILIYVDDVIVICNTEGEFAAVANNLEKHFKLSVMGDLKFFLGIQIRCENGRFRINQRAYLSRVLEQFGMTQAKPSKVPMDVGFLQQKEESSKPLESGDQYRRLVGILLYAAVTSRPDISIATSILGRRVQNPTEADWCEAKRILRYIKGTLNVELCLGYDERNLECSVDADWAGDVSDRKSNSGFLFKFGGGVIGWGCHKQTCVALSSTEAEYIALAECLQEVKYVFKLLEDLGEPIRYPIC